MIEPCLEFLKQQRWVEIAGSSVFGGASFRYRITDGGRARANLALEQNQYVGIAPVPLDQYRAYMAELKRRSPLQASREHVRQAFCISSSPNPIIDSVGPAVNAGHSMFVYGSPGNGKTDLAQAIRNLLDGDMHIPQALEVKGQIIGVLRPGDHQPLLEHRSGRPRAGGHWACVDRRWIRCRRPLVMVGGEFTLEALELSYNPIR